MKNVDMMEEKTKRRKRHIVTDTMGNLLCVHVHAGNIHDTKGGVYTLEKALYHYPTLIGVCADQGYRGTFKNTFEIFHNIKVDISPRIKNEFEIQPVRWVVERTFGWMTWSRRLSKDYEIKTFYQENICIISNLQTLLRRFQLVKTGSYIRDAVCISFCLNELLSIIENTTLMGIPFPPAFKKAIDVLQTKVGRTEDEKEDE